TTDEAVRDDGEVALGRGGRLLDERPGAIDASVEDLPAFPVRRRVARGEHVEAQLRVGRAADVAEVALLEEGVIAHGGAGGAPQVVGRGDRSRKIAREDAGDALSLEAPGQPLGLGHAAGRERVVGKLDGARRIAQRLAVADEKDGHEALPTKWDGATQITRSRRRPAMSPAA